MDIPKILLKNTDDYETKPWSEPNQKISDYFNYNFKEDVWNEYIHSLKIKYDEINNLLLDKNIKNNFNSESYKDIETYLFNFPSDLGGLGEIYNDQKYEDLNFFYYKPSGKIIDLPHLEYKQNTNTSQLNIELPQRANNSKINSEIIEIENKKEIEISGNPLSSLNATDCNFPTNMPNMQQAYMNQYAYMNYMRMNIAARQQLQNNMLLMQEYQKNWIHQQEEEKNERHSHKHKKEKKKKKKKDRSRSRSRSNKEKSNEEKEKKKKKSSHKEKNKDKESKKHRKRSNSVSHEIND